MSRNSNAFRATLAVAGPMSGRTWLRACAWRCLVLALGATGPAIAARPPPPSPEPPPPSPERPLPNYDGRGERPATTGEVLLWVPRVALFPLYLVSEYGIRKPLGWLTTAAEENDLPALLVDFFTFGPERNVGLIPTGLIDFGLRPSVGLYFFADKVGFKENHLRARAAYGGSDWFLFSALDRIDVAPRQTLSLKGEWWIRPDRLYYGLGSRASGEESHFRENHKELHLTHEAGLWRSSAFESSVGVRKVDLDFAVGCCGSPTVDEEVRRGRFASPPGGSGYTVGYSRLLGALDSRRRRKLDQPREGSDFVSPPGDGVKLALRGEYAGDLAATKAAWLHYGATLGGFLDLGGAERVVGLSVIADFVDPVGADGAIPFTEQVSLGGARPMRGFLEHRLIDRSAVVAQLDYTWPIWVWLDGSAHYAVGNVFGKHLDGFAPELLRSSFGVGVRANSARDHTFEALLAFGTETVQAGMGIDTVRFVLGATHGF